MRPRYVVDTNVLIAASAGDPVSPSDIDATPADPALRTKVWKWLHQFESSDARLVLDRGGKIWHEYQRKLGFNDYGIQVVQHKWSTAAVDDVDVPYDPDGNGVLPADLTSVVHDLSDRKLVGAALAAHEAFGETAIAFAADSDWFDWITALRETGLQMEPVLEDWRRGSDTPNSGVSR